MKKILYALILSLTVVFALGQAMRVYNSIDDLVAASHNPESENKAGWVLNTNDFSYRFWFWWPDPALTNVSGPLYTNSLRPGVVGTYVLSENLHWNQAPDLGGSNIVVVINNTNQGGLVGALTVPYLPRAIDTNRLADSFEFWTATGNGTSTNYYWGTGGTNVQYLIPAQNLLMFTNGSTANTGVGLGVMDGNGHIVKLLANGTVGQIVGAGNVQAIDLTDNNNYSVRWYNRNLTPTQPYSSLGAYSSSNPNNSWSNLWLHGTAIVEVASLVGTPNYARLSITQTDTNTPIVFDSQTTGTAGYSRGFSFRTNGVEVFNVTGTGGPSSGANWTAVGTTDSSLAGTAIADTFSARGFYSPSAFGITTNLSDCSTLFNAMLATVYNAGGGTIVFPPGKFTFTGRITLPKTALTNNPIRITGASAPFYALNNYSANGGTILELAITGQPSKIVTLGAGLLEIDHITLQNSTSSTGIPFIKTTLTTLWLHDMAFIGYNPQSAADEDIVVFGGTNTLAVSTDEEFMFQGYGSSVRNCFFQNARSIVFNLAANGILVDGNTWWTACGGTNAPIMLNGQLDSRSIGYWQPMGNVIKNNLVEMGYYTNFAVINHTAWNNLLDNGLWDGISGSGVLLLDGAKDNTISYSYFSGTLDPIAPTTNAVKNTFLTAFSSSTNNFSRPVTIPTTLTVGNYIGTGSITNSGTVGIGGVITAGSDTYLHNTYIFDGYQFGNFGGMNALFYGGKVYYYANGMDYASQSAAVFDGQDVKSSGTVYGNNLYATNDCSALTFTDRSGSPSSLPDAYSIVQSHQTKDGKVDHSKLHRLAWGKDRTGQPDQNSRDIGMVLSAQQMVIQDLLARIEKLEKK